MLALNFSLLVQKLRGVMNYEIRNILAVVSVIAGLIFSFTGSTLIFGDNKDMPKEAPAARKLINKHKSKLKTAQKAKAAQSTKPVPQAKNTRSPASKSKTLRRIAKKSTASTLRSNYSSRGVVRRTASVAKASTVAATFSGKASWYSFSRNHGMFAALRGYRGKSVRVTGPKGTIIVNINDYGPQKWTGKVIDLSAEAFKAAIGPLSKGVGYVNIEILK